MDVPCRLVGGPYEGDRDTMAEPLPDRIWVFPCPNCGLHVIWAGEWVAGAEVYRQDEPDGAGCVFYVFEDAKLRYLLQAEQREPVHA